MGLEFTFSIQVRDQQRQLELQDIIIKKIRSEDIKKKINDINEGLPTFNIELYKKIQEISLGELTGDFFKNIVKEIKSSVKGKSEMQDFAIAEYNLIQFCNKEGLKNPERLYEHKDDAISEEITTTYFTPDLIGDSAIAENERIKKNRFMVTSIKKWIPAIIAGNDNIEFFTQEDSKMNRYFYNHSLQKYKNIRYKTLAILDDRSKADMDLIFTTEGIMPVIKGKAKNTLPYNKIHWSSNNNKKALKLSVNYRNENIDMDELYELIQELASNEAPVENNEQK